MTDRRRIAALAAPFGAGLTLVLALGLGGPGTGPAVARAETTVAAPLAGADGEAGDGPAAPAGVDFGVFLPPKANAETASTTGPGADGTTRASSGRTNLERLWLAEASDPDRIGRVEGTVRQLGVTSFDGAGRALLLTGSGATTAEEAARVAPGLPYAQGALARARLGAGDPIGAVTALVAGLLALDRHVEASLWLRAQAFQAVAFACTWGGLAFLLVAGFANLRRAAHDVGDALWDEMPSWQRLLLVGALVLLPASLGQGAFGLALGLLGLGLAGGDPKLRPALAGAAVACWLGAQPLIDAAGRALAAFEADPVALAAWSVESESARASELERLAAAEDADPLARRALAVHARRRGDLAGADARYAALVDAGEADAALLNNAANVRFARGRLDEAIPLYQGAAALQRSAVLFFNLAQAYGSDIRSSDQDLALAKAQALDRGLVGELTALEPNTQTALAVDLPTPPAMLRARLLAAPDAAGVADALRAGFAPGALGRSPIAMALALLAVGAASVIATRGHSPARWCRQCGARCCPRCDDPPDGLAVCRDCARTLPRKDGAHAGRRSERLAQARERERRLRPLWLMASLVLPAVAALRDRRPLLALTGALGFALAVGASPLAPHFATDPLAAGLPGGLALGLLLTIGLAAHLASIALARRGGRR